MRVGSGRDRPGAPASRVLRQVREPVGPGGEHPARHPRVAGRASRNRCAGPFDRELIMGSPRYQLFVLGRYPSLVARDDPQVAVEVRVGRDSRLVNCGTLTLRESEWEVLRTGLELGLGRALDVIEWPERVLSYRPA